MVLLRNLIFPCRGCGRSSRNIVGNASVGICRRVRESCTQRFRASGASADCYEVCNRVSSCGLASRPSHSCVYLWSPCCGLLASGGLVKGFVPCLTTFLSILSDFYLTGLITSIVNGNDVVPTLSLGFLRDLTDMATLLSEDSSVTEEVVCQPPPLYLSIANKPH